MSKLPLSIRFCILTTCAFALPLCGCQDDSITWHESVPVTRSSPEDPGGNAKQDDREYRMITAIADRSDATWFFKLTGPKENTESVEEGWAQFLDSIKFGETEPTWDLPESWVSAGFQDKALGGGMVMRMADIQTSDEETKVSVSSLPAGQELLSNVNRWRGQLGLAPTDAVRLATELMELKNESAEFKIFDAVGPTLTTRMGGAPFAGRRGQGKTAPHSGGMSGSPHGHMGSMPAGTAPSQMPFQFDQPEGWETGKTSSMVIGNWSKQLGPEGDKATMKLLTMNPTDESWQLNVEAWARQVKIDPPSVDDVTGTVKVGGKEARAVRLFGEQRDNPAENPALTAVMFSNPQGNGYVLMLTGSEFMVGESETEFNMILNSINFETANDE